MSTELLEERVEKLEKRLDALEQKVAGKKRRAFGTPLDEVKAMLGTPVKRTEEDIKRALSIAGIWDGPADLSANLRAYLRGEKK